MYCHINKVKMGKKSKACHKVADSVGSISMIPLVFR